MLAFLPVLSAGFVNWDDDVNLVDNSAWRGFGFEQLRWMATTFHMGHYQPLTWLSFAIDHALWGMNPHGYHATNLLLHGLAAWAFYLVLVELFGAVRDTPDRSASSGIGIGPLAGSLLFALHPLRVESVAWVTERRDPLSGLFVLLSLLYYLRCRSVGPGGPFRRGLVASFVFFVLAVLSKGLALTLPAVMLVVDAWPLRRFDRRPDGPTVAERIGGAIVDKLPFFAVSVVSAILSIHGARALGALSAWKDHTPVDRVVQACYGLAFYLAKGIFPAGLAPLYSLEAKIDPSRPVHLAALLFVAGVTVAAWTLRRRLPALAAAWVAYGLLLAPVLGFFQSGPQKVADRYSYLALLPWAALAGFGFEEVERRFQRRRLLVRSGGTAVAILLGIATFRQASVWHDSTSLWRRVIEVEPSSFKANLNLGIAEAQAGRMGEAAARFERALENSPDSAPAHFQAGIALSELGRTAEAAAHFDRAVELDPASPKAFYNRGLLREKTGNVEGAAADFARALELNPSYAEALFRRASLRRKSGDVQGALADFTRLTELSPGAWNAWGNRGLLLAALGRKAEALESLRRALPLVPAPMRSQIDAAIAQVEKGPAPAAGRQKP